MVRSTFRVRLLWVAGIGLLALVRCLASSGPARVANVEPMVALRERQLQSGLELLIDAERSSPLAGATFFVNAGGAADPPGKEGLAHLVEHLVFRSRHGDKPRVDSRLNAIVADWNGGTTQDWVYYYLFAPHAEFDEALGLTFEMMTQPIVGVSQAEFEHERSIVKAELGFRSEHFVGAIDQMLNETVFEPGTTAARPVGGTEQSLETLTLSDVESFAERHYQPEQMTLYVALPPGRSEADFVHALPPALSGVEFQRKRQPKPPASKIARRAPGTIERRYASVAYPQLFFGWPLPNGELAERARAELMSDFLDVRARPSFESHRDIAGGECGVRSFQGVSLLWCRLDLNTAANARQVADRWLSDVRQTFTGNSTAWSWWLQQRFVLGRVLAAEQLQNRAFARAEAAFEHGSHTAYDRLLADAQKVQMPELFATGYEQMQLERSYMLLVLPHADQSPGPPLRTGLATPSEESTSADSATDAIAALKQLPPGALGNAVTRKLDNGLEVIVLPRPGQYSTALLGFRGGTAWAGSAAVARAAVAAETWNISPDPVTWGVMLERHRVLEATFEVARVVGDRLPKAFEVLGSARTATVEWPNNQFRRSAGALERFDAAPDRVAQRKTWAVLFDRHPMGAFAPLATLEQVPVQSVRQYHTSLRRPDNAVLVVVGPSDPDAVVGLAQKEFGSWRHGTSRLSAPPPMKPRGPGVGRPLVAVHRAAATQVDIEYTCLVPVKSLDDQARMDLLQSMLEDELWTNLREQSGVAYSAWVEADQTLEGAGWLQLETRVAAEHLSHALQVFESLGDEGTVAFSEVIFEKLRYRRVRGQAFVDGSTRASAGRLYNAWLLGRSPSQLDQFPDRLARTSLSAVRDTLEHCRRHAVLTLLGDARVINAAVGRQVVSP